MLIDGSVSDRRKRGYNKEEGEFVNAYISWDWVPVVLSEIYRESTKVLR